MAAVLLNMGHYVFDQQRPGLNGDEVQSHFIPKTAAIPCQRASTASGGCSTKLVQLIITACLIPVSP